MTFSPCLVQQQHDCSFSVGLRTPWTVDIMKGMSPTDKQLVIDTTKLSLLNLEDVGHVGQRFYDYDMH